MRRNSALSKAAGTAAVCVLAAGLVAGGAATATAASAPFAPGPGGGHGVPGHVGHSGYDGGHGYPGNYGHPRGCERPYYRSHHRGVYGSC